MSDEKLYETGVDANTELVCTKHKLTLVPRQVTMSYMGSAFQVTLPACPQCGMLYIPEELANGKILHVEQSLEDK